MAEPLAELLRLRVRTWHGKTWVDKKQPGKGSAARIEPAARAAISAVVETGWATDRPQGVVAVPAAVAARLVVEVVGFMEGRPGPAALVGGPALAACAAVAGGGGNKPWKRTCKAATT